MKWRNVGFALVALGYGHGCGAATLRHVGLEAFSNFAIAVAVAAVIGAVFCFAAASEQPNPEVAQLRSEVRQLRGQLADLVREKEP